MTEPQPKEYLLEVTARMVVSSLDFPPEQLESNLKNKIRDMVLCHRETVTLIETFSRLQEGQEYEED